MFPVAWTISADLYLALLSGRTFRGKSPESTFRMGSAIHLSLGAINLDTTPIWIGKKLNLLKNMVFLIRPKRGKYIHIYFKPNSILSLSKKSTFFTCPPWEWGSRFTSCEPLPHRICSHSRAGFATHTWAPLPENCSANDPLLSRFALYRFYLPRWTFFFPLLWRDFPPPLQSLGTWKLDIFWTEMKDLELGNTGEEKREKGQRATDVNKHSIELQM